ncbi:MAG: SEC-C metal-binding domain-containing protein [Desulfatiglandaceae bacterium]
MKKIGRNDPCPCGSGKKFKNCHLGKEDELTLEGRGEFSADMSRRITALPQVWYGRSQEMVQSLDLYKLTGVAAGIRLIDMGQYEALDLLGRSRSSSKEKKTGGLLVNVLKTKTGDPDNIYIAISPDINESALIHQLAHVLDYLGGSKLMPGLAKPLSYDLEIPVEHVEHPHEFGYWLNFLYTRFEVRPDADDAIIEYLYKNEMLLKGSEIEAQQRTLLKSKSDRMMRFLSDKSQEIDDLICELPGYIGSRVNKD